MATELEIQQTLAVLASVYPKSTANAGTIPLYIRLLADIPGELLQKAALEHIARSAFFPTIAELRQAALDLQEAANPLPDAYDAWAEVLREMDRVGWLTIYGLEIRFSHPLIDEVVRLFGWQRLCSSENSISDRAQFIAAYNARLEKYRLDARRPTEVRAYLAQQRAVAELEAGGKA